METGDQGEASGDAEGERGERAEPDRQVVRLAIIERGLSHVACAPSVERSIRCSTLLGGPEESKPGLHQP
jgi:hypothetical protein